MENIEHQYKLRIAYKCKTMYSIHFNAREKYQSTRERHCYAILILRKTWRKLPNISSPQQYGAAHLESHETENSNKNEGNEADEAEDVENDAGEDFETEDDDEEEEEFTPSAWDATLAPHRSALRSPDKTAKTGVSLWPPDSPHIYTSLINRSTLWMMDILSCLIICSLAARMKW